MTISTIAVVGASTAGLAAAGALRSAGFDGRLVLVGDEPHRPYDRPPLTKQFLSGEWDADRLTFPAGDDPTLDAEWRTGVRATALDAATRTITLDDGSTLAVDGIVLACGARPRRLTGSEPVRGVHVVRTIEDATALRADLDVGPERVVVVGAGFVGCEVAATCRERGIDVTLVDPLGAPLEGVFGPTVGAVFARLHTDAGVDLRTGVGVASFEAGGDGRVRTVRLTDGSVLDARVVVVGVGAVPATDWLVGSGLVIDDGIVCDATCTAAPGVVAAGDVLRWPNPAFGGEVMRVEHWDHAFGSAEHAAASLLAGGDAEPFTSVPWFWSDQYGHKVQLTGRVRPDDTVTVAQGSLDEDRHLALFSRGGRLTGVLGMGKPRHVIGLRPRIAEGITLDEALAVIG